MTATATHSRPAAPTVFWSARVVLVAAILGSSALAAVEALVGPGAWYSWVLTAVVTITAGLIATNDAVSLTLPNRYTAAFAAAAAIQAITHAAVRHDWTIAAWAGVAGITLFVAYIVFGLLGWAGFGDAKFAAGLGIAAATIAGLAALYVFPIAIVLAGIWRATRLALGRSSQSEPHGPALAIATVLVMLWTALLGPVL